MNLNLPPLDLQQVEVESKNEMSPQLRRSRRNTQQSQRYSELDYQVRSVSESKVPVSRGSSMPPARREHRSSSPSVPASVEAIAARPQIVNEIDAAEEILGHMKETGSLYRSLPRSAQKHWVLRGSAILKQYVVAEPEERTEHFVSLLKLVQTCLRRPIRGGRKNYRNNVLSLIHRINKPHDEKVNQDQEAPVPQQVAAEEKKQVHVDAANPAHDEEKSPPLSKREIDRIVALTNGGNVRRAVGVLSNRNSEPFDRDVSVELQNLFPARKANFEAVDDDNKAAPAKVDAKLLCKIIRKFCTGASPGPSGWTPELLLPLAEDKQACKYLCVLMSHIIRNDVSKTMRLLLTACRLVPIPKKNRSIRPIAIPEVFFKIAGKYALTFVDTAKILPKYQFGVGKAAGADMFVHRANRLLQTGKMALSLDIANGFNEVQRAFLLGRLREEEAAHQLIPFFHLAYGAGAMLLYRTDGGTKVIWSREGVRQGDPTSSLLFAIALQPALKAAAEKLGSDDYALAFVDDTLLIGESDKLAAAKDAFSAKALEAGLVINQVKSSVLNISGDQPAAEELARILEMKVKNQEQIMGAPIGPDEWQRDFVIKMAEDRVKELPLLLDPRIPLQVALSIVFQSRQLTMCYLARLVDPKNAEIGFSTYDTALREWFMEAIDCLELLPSRQEEIVTQMQYPTSAGGLGLLDMKQRSNISYIVSVFNSFTARELESFDSANKTYDSNVKQAFQVFRASLEELKEHKVTSEISTWKGLCEARSRIPYLSEKQVRQPFITALKEEIVEKAKVEVKDGMSPKAIRDLMMAKRMVHASRVPVRPWSCGKEKSEGGRLSNKETQLCLQLLLGAGPPGVCQHCQEKQDDLVTHVTWCKGTAAHRTFRHTALVKTLCKLHQDAGFTAHVEMKIRKEGVPDLEIGGKDQELRLDVIVSNGHMRHVAFDVTIFSPLAKSYLNKDTAQQRTTTKRDKYDQACKRHDIIFAPFVVNVYGQLTSEGRKSLSRIATAWLLDGQDPDEPHTVAEMRKLVFRTFYTSFQKLTGNFLRQCQVLRRISSHEQ